MLNCVNHAKMRLFWVLIIKNECGGYMMKKVGIITIYDNNNYGNRLQNYALQEYVDFLGFEVQTIRNIPYKELNNGTVVSALKKIKRLILNAPGIGKKTRNKEIEQWKEHLYGPYKNSERIKAFSEFNNYISFFPDVIGYYNMKQLNTQFDFFITGSDQVWNPVLGRGTGLDFLTFANEEKRIAYAASISLDKIPEEFNYRFLRYLNSMKKISLREQQGVDLIKKEFNVDSTCVIDPTMLIDKHRWQVLADSAKVQLPKKYVLCMFLGDKENEQTIREYAQKHGCEIMWLNDPNDKDTYSFGPIEFLYAVSHANMFFTDSFHGCVFSMLFHIDFYAIERKGEADYMFSRIAGLLSKFGLRRRALSCEDLNSIELIDEETWARVDEILRQERIKSKCFFREALELE